MTDLFDRRNKTLLHIAPEWSFVEVFNRLPRLKYVTADIASPLAKLHLDITALPFVDGFFDVIYCSHVLEHVPDDLAAMREFCRVLKPGGWFLPDVPILRENTFEDSSVDTPEDRELLFGQSDHVRVYGKDFKERLECCGFQVQVETLAHDLGREKRIKYGIDECELYFCRRN